MRCSQNDLQRRVVEVDADDALVAQLLRPLVRVVGLAAADVEQRLRGGLGEQRRSSARSKPACRRLTTGLVELYLSYVLPVTVPSASTVTVGVIA